jgi:uncharacterized cupin superfamily protein
LRDGTEIVLQGSVGARQGASARQPHQFDVLYLEVGDRTAGDAGFYPADHISASQDTGGKWVYSHKDGTPLGALSPLSIMVSAFAAPEAD